MLRARILAAAIAPLLVEPGACAPDDGQVGRELEPIIGGLADSGDPAVVALTIGRSPTCTGTLISSRVVMTAGHCVYSRVPDGVFFGQATSGDGRTIPVATGYTIP